MARFFFLLSGEHSSLPAAEVVGACEALGHTFKPVDVLDQVLVGETSAEPAVLAERLAMSWMIGFHLFTSPAFKREILDSLFSSDFLEIFNPRKTFAITVKRIKKSAQHLQTPELEKWLAEKISREVKFKTDLRNPEFELVFVLTGESCVGGVKVAEVDRKRFTARRPSRRPAFHPSTLTPVLARCMVNLARTPPGGIFLDPFCGVGGILIEAGLVGAIPVGIDIKPEMVEGAKKNLEAFGIRDYRLEVGDARKLGGMEVDAIATDPPYGRQATTAGSEVWDLYRESLHSMTEVLKPGRFLCITAPADIRETGKEAGLEVVDYHEQKVHRSLIRCFHVFRKPGSF
ncbi:MAG: methyltransferase domain-containing protein [Candidatus Hadarchaeales archaeon]